MDSAGRPCPEGPEAINSDEWTELCSDDVTNDAASAADDAKLLIRSVGNEEAP